jgi:hypothetical protein
LIEFAQSTNKSSLQEQIDFSRARRIANSELYRQLARAGTQDNMAQTLIPEFHHPESKVLIIITGGTIVMQRSADGLVPVCCCSLFLSLSLIILGSQLSQIWTCPLANLQ